MHRAPIGSSTALQVDSVVRAGSSGGPLRDDHGRVIGLTIGGAALGGRIGVGLNEFLGIEDAWRALQVEPQVTIINAADLLRP